MHAFFCRSLSEARAYLSKAGVYEDAENYPTPDVIIRELRVGSESGLELLAWIQGVTELRTIPLYVLAGGISNQDCRALRGMMQIKRIFVKPPANDELERLLRGIADEVADDRAGGVKGAGKGEVRRRMEWEKWEI